MATAGDTVTRGLSMISVNDLAETHLAANGGKNTTYALELINQFCDGPKDHDLVREAVEEYYRAHAATAGPTSADCSHH